MGRKEANTPNFGFLSIVGMVLGAPIKKFTTLEVVVCDKLILGIKVNCRTVKKKVEECLDSEEVSELEIYWLREALYTSKQHAYINRRLASLLQNILGNKFTNSDTKD